MDSLEKLFTLPSERMRIRSLIKTSPSPSLAANNLARLMESGGRKAVDKIPREDLPALVRLLGASTFLSDILIRQGKNWPQLFTRQIKISEKPAARHLTELESLIAKASSFNEFSAGLRQHKQREYLRIGTRDLAPSVSLEDTVKELTSLAEASLDAAYRFSRAQVEKEFGSLFLPGRQEPNRFAVIGMGKLGGAELNFSSDVDVIFLYENDEGESSGGTKGKADPRTFFTNVAKKIIQAMGDVTEYGFVFRIDLRLRPLGAHGPLVQSADSATFYYQSWGQSWERAALVKARAVAGDRPLGLQFLKELESFVYRRYLDYTTVEELRHLKSRIENELLTEEGKERNIKLGYGGIREVEFFTQAMQLVNGGYEPRLREPNTLRAVDLLAEHQFIPLEVKDHLSRAYRFLRQVEHKVQMVQEAHAHSIPQGADEELALARRLGYSAKTGSTERDLFWQDHRRHTTQVRNIFDGLFYSAQKEMADSSASGAGSIWNDLDQREPIIRELEKVGFKDPAKAYENLLAVRDGEAHEPPSPKRIKIMRTLGPALVTEISRSTAPDQAVLNLAKFSHRIGGRSGFLRLLAENPRTMRLLVTLFAESQFLTDLFLNRPELIDTLIRVDLTRIAKTREEMLAELTASINQADDIEVKLDALRRYKNEEFIRIGLHDLGATIDIEQVLAQLSDLAEVCVESALQVVFEELQSRFGVVPGGEFAVLGMGKIGGRELDYNSDLDLIFIYDAAEDSESSGGSQGTLAAHEFYVRAGQKLITYLSAATQEGVAYKIDMQLRPSGKSGPLVSSLEAFREYHQSSSALWERQALIKGRCVSGDRELGKAIEEVVQSFAYSGGLDHDGVAEIHHLRMRMEKELAHEDESRFNLKKGRGGLVDIEFLTQMLQLVHGHRHPQIRHRETLQALNALSDIQILKKSEHKLLHDSYLFLRRLDHRLRLERDQSIDALERDPERLDGVAQALGYGSRSRRTEKSSRRPGVKLLQDYENKREKIRACYEQYFLGPKIPKSLKQNKPTFA